MRNAETRPPADKASVPEMLTPHILVVDDERQVHSSLRLRLASENRLMCLSSPTDALAAIAKHQFDLCLVDIRMPDMDGLDFIEAARAIDPALGYVVLSAYGSEDNLRRAIPLQIFDFLPKPLPDRNGFETRISGWVARTRARRDELKIAQCSRTLVQDLEVARIEREVELTASAAAREALLQTATRLTVTQALLLSVQHALEPLCRSDSRLSGVMRSLSEARKQAEAAANVADTYFSSAYADRESSPALINTCMMHGIDISMRCTKAEERSQRIDFIPLGRDAVLSGVTGIDLLLMLVPALIHALAVAGPGSTVQVRCDEVTRMDQLFAANPWRNFLWVNRRHVSTSGPGVFLSITSRASALDEEAVRSWLRGEPSANHQSSRGLLHGIQEAKALLGVATRPQSDRYALAVCLRI